MICNTLNAHTIAVFDFAERVAHYYFLSCKDLKWFQRRGGVIETLLMRSNAWKSHFHTVLVALGAC